MAPGVAGSYRRLLAEPVLRRLAVADVCARLPQGMLSITLLLVAAEHATMTVAGFALAGYALGLAGLTAAAGAALAGVAAGYPVLGLALAAIVAAAAAAAAVAQTGRSPVREEVPRS